MKKTAVFVAGGTAGHINSALSLGEYYLKQHGSSYDVLYISAKRPLDLKLYPKEMTVHFDAMALKGKSPLQMVKSLFLNLKVFFDVLNLLRRKNAAFILGAGGYVCGPVCLAGYLLGIPVFVLEQNSVMGITNKVLGLFAKKVFVNFPETIGAAAYLRPKIILSGNPIRESFLKIRPPSPPHSGEGRLNFLVFGGSLGADSINKMILDWVQSLAGTAEAGQIAVRHQIGVGKLAAYEKMLQAVRSVNYTPLEYLDNIFEDYNWSHLILCRSGASTVSELRVVGRPCILIPYPHHQDRHQYYNAEFLKKEVPYPVLVASCEELTANNFELLRNFLAKVRNYYQNPQMGHPDSVEAKIAEPLRTIAREIEHYV